MNIFYKSATILIRQGFTGLLLCLAITSGAQKLSINAAVTEGVTRQLADYRSATLSHIGYKLYFDIPADRAKPIIATETLSFLMATKGSPLQIDFKGDAEQLEKVTVNDKPVAIDYRKEHLIIAASYLKPGYNTVDIQFQSASAALNRNDDYLYTLLVPDRARTVFPCFDQPDLKAIFTLTLNIPVLWNVIANGKLKDTLRNNGKKICRFAPSDKISTYLFSFAAGKFTSVNGKVANTTAQFLYRETDPVKIARSVDSVFNDHTDAVNFLSGWTAIPYPFQKIGFVAIPDFQFGGMEHVGAVQYKASSLFLDDGATKDQMVARSTLISHETSHMWFGDMVSIRWFNDVWMKEVFANIMADKVTEKLTGKDSFDLKFLTDHFPAAYGIDRTLGANPIRQNLDNLNQAGSLYGNIIYHKAPIMMRQLERLMGKDQFQAGVRQYLKKFAYKNASWPDLIGILNRHSKVNLLQWNKVWVNQNGRPVIDYQITYKGDKINSFMITQKPEYGVKKVWPQLFEVAFFYRDGIKELTVNLTGGAAQLKQAFNLPKPRFVLFNSSGQGYGLWPVDHALLPQLYTIKSPLMRASAYISLYENMLNGSVLKPAGLLTLLMDGLSMETEELNLRLLTAYIANIYWEFTPQQEREKLSPKLEEKLLQALQQQASANNKKLLFKAYQDVFLSNDAYRNMYAIWKDQKAPAGVKLNEDDYTSLSFALKLRNDADTTILNQQLKRITNPDRRKRFEFITPALSASETQRDHFFASLQDKANRSKESNVLSALGYLHHPIRQASSVKYLQKSLAMLEEIQVTGDIFFPQSWLQASFGNYQSAEAKRIVDDFLAAHPNYNPKLKAKILQATDNLVRAQTLLR